MTSTGPRKPLKDALVIVWRDLPGLRDPDRFDFWIQRVLTSMYIEHAPIVAIGASCRAPR